MPGPLRPEYNKIQQLNTAKKSS